MHLHEWVNLYSCSEPIKFLAPFPRSFGTSVNIDNSLLRYYFRHFFSIFFYPTKNSTSIHCGVSGSSGTCMHRQGRGELEPFDQEI